MPFLQEPTPHRKPGAPLVVPKTEVPPEPKVEEPEVTHRYVYVRARQGHTFDSALGVKSHYGPGRHWVPLDVARIIENQECRVAQEDQSFKDTAPLARILYGGGRSIRVSPEELDALIGRA